MNDTIEQRPIPENPVICKIVMKPILKVNRNWEIEEVKKHFGMFVATKDEDGLTVRVGWSKLHRLDKDNFDADRGFQIALARTQYCGTEFPRTMEGSELERFVARCKKYFHSDVVIVMGKPYGNA